MAPWELEEIKAAGGTTFAQDESALHNSRPRYAVASGCVDSVLSPEEIANEIARISRHSYVGQEKSVEIEDGQTGEHQGHSHIAQILLAATRMNFTNYKDNTLHRRITRRMLLHKLDTLKEYETYLEQTPAEVEALFHDILINVISFFRDPIAFEALKSTIFPRLLEAQPAQKSFRIWTLGCSTGEEAYSLAMAFTERTEKSGSKVSLQVFGRDANQTCIDKTRAGVYRKSIAADLPPECLHRFFTEVESGYYRISKAIREYCIFSRACY